MHIILIDQTPLPTSSLYFFKILDIIKWPLVVLIIFVLFIIIFNKVLKAWLPRLSKFKIFGAEILATTEIQKQDDIRRELSEVDRAVATFSKELINDNIKIIKQQSSYESELTNEKKLETLLNYAAVTYINWIFDQLYNYILGSQLQLLLQLNTLRGRGEIKDKLKVYYDNAVVKFEKNYENYSYDEYFKFLIDTELIKESNGKYNITIKGADFLKYITSVGKTFNLPN